MHKAALTLTKIADGLIDPKLVLAWVMTAVGAPAAMLGALVPVREAGALMPQIALAPWIERQPRRAWIWAAGSLVQGLAALAIALAAVVLDGAAAGLAILIALAILAVARSACSASYKDILARTVEKGARGQVSGTAASLAAAAVLAFAVALGLGVIPRSLFAISVAIGCAGILWVVAAGVFTRIPEPEATPSEAAANLSRLVEPLRTSPELRQYIAARALLISTALAPPFLVLLTGSGEAGLGNLGLLMIASNVAALVSGWLWGRLSDRSSRKTMALAGALSAVTLTAAAIAGWMGIATMFGAGPVLLLISQLAYQGARTGRKTHLTDMDTDGRKPAYTALSNGVIGVLLLAGGIIGVIADLAGPAAALAVLAGMSALAIPTALRMTEVQGD